MHTSESTILPVSFGGRSIVWDVIDVDQYDNKAFFTTRRISSLMLLLHGHPNVDDDEAVDDVEEGCAGVTESTICEGNS
jgi:hypothetical protein